MPEIKFPIEKSTNMDSYCGCYKMAENTKSSLFHDNSWR